MPAFVLFATLTLSTSASAGSGIYRYVEPDGTVVYTNVPPRGARAAKAAQKIEREFTAAPSPTRPLEVTASSVRASELYSGFMLEAATRYKIPLELVKAITHAESNFDHMAVSPVGASGLMQLMPQTAREMFVSDIFDPQQNIEGGVRYLRVLANEFNGDMVKMIAAYNAGPDAVRRYNGAIPPFFETQTYVRRVLALYFQYKNSFSQAVAQP
jgi:soluble lytic murein transglycosylase-like protein